MQIQRRSSINFKNYKRFFAFGCSFTEYKWWTWADIIGSHFGDQYYNYGLCGSGNTAILYQFVEANKRYNFTKDDLVIVQWSGIFREDRYLNNQWAVQGNISSSTTGLYDDDFIDKYVDIRGFYLRDALNLNLVIQILSKLDCDWDLISMLPLKIHEGEYDTVNYPDIDKLFHDDIALVKPSFYEVLFNCSYRSRHNDLADNSTNPNSAKDIHPTPLMHLEFLEKTYNLNLSKSLYQTVKQNNIDILRDGGKLHTRGIDWETYIPSLRKKVDRL